MEMIKDLLKRNNEKYENIKELAKKFIALEDLRLKKIGEIHNIYVIAFRNFYPGRKKTNVKIKGLYQNDNCEVYLNRNGISIKEWKYSENTSHIEKFDSNQFITLLKRIGEKKEEILEFIEKKEKKKIFIDFYDGIEKLEEEKTFKEKLKEKLDVFDAEGINIEPEFYELSRGTFRIKGEGWKRESINIRSPGLKDKFFIEQIYNELIFLLKKYIKLNEQQIKDYEMFINKLNINFSKHIIVNNL